MKFKLKTGSKGAAPTLSIEANKDDELAYVDAERVYRGDLDSFLPFSYDREGRSFEFVYYLGATVSLERLLSAPLAPDVLRNCLGSLLHMMQLCEQHGLSRLRVVHEPEFVYYDFSTGMLKFAYVPARSYVSEMGEAGLVSRICSATMTSADDQQFAVSVWDFVHRTTILTSVALESFLESWGLQSGSSRRSAAQRGRSALGTDTRSDHGWDFVTAIRQDEARRQEEDRLRAARVAEEANVSAPPEPAAGARDPRFDQGRKGEQRFLLTRRSTGQSFAIGDGRHVIGRDADCSIPLPDSRGISRKHAALDVRGSECVLHDLNSTNGVFLNGSRLDSGSSVTLTSGTLFSLGEEEFSLE